MFHTALPLGFLFLFQHTNHFPTKGPSPFQSHSVRFALLHWDDEAISRKPIKCIQDPRKNIDQYKVGEHVSAICPGFSGGRLHREKIAAISGRSNQPIIKNLQAGRRRVQCSLGSIL